MTKITNFILANRGGTFLWRSGDLTPADFTEGYQVGLGFSEITVPEFLLTDELINTIVGFMVHEVCPVQVMKPNDTDGPFIGVYFRDNGCVSFEWSILINDLASAMSAARVLQQSAIYSWKDQQSMEVVVKPSSESRIKEAIANAHD